MSDSRPPRILIADDEPLFLRTTAELLRRAGYDCTKASDGKTALEALEAQEFDLVLSDLNMPGNLKLELLQEQRRRWSGVPLIVVTGAPSLPTAIESLRLGITDYLLKPVRYQDLLSSVQRALAQHRRTEQPPETPPTASAEGSFPEIIGESPPMLELKQVLERVATTETNVLITGESGTGKEVVAAAIHRHSSRASAEFQVIDCTAIPESLFESMLFGHARGSFTGAVKDQEGLLIRADKGTAFFDEIGELAAPLQAKLLRLIQEQTFTPVGKTTPIQVDTRFLCATNRNLELEVQAGRFRRDLYYRLAVIHIELAPLRRRGDDVLLLARHFLRALQPEEIRVRDLSPETVELFRHYEWPGNIRELRNAMERGIALARGDVIVPADLPPTLLRGSGTTPADVESPPPVAAAASSRGEALQGAERDYLISILSANHGNVARSAKQAGMSRQGLHKLLKKHGVDAAEFRR